jgi:FkbM family methyltransferase
MKLKTKIFNILRLILRNPLTERFLIQLTKNKKPNHVFAKLPANYYQYKKPTLRPAVIDGVRFHLDISDYMEWLLYFGIQAEPRDVLYKYASQSKIIFDVGGNFGETALFMAKFAPSDAIIHVFEPDSYCFEKLKKNMSMNKFHNIILHNFGFGAEPGMYYLKSDNEHNRGGNKIHLNKDISPNVTIKRIDDFVKEMNIQRVDLIKIDVEGFEYHVLRGAEHTIKNYKPTLFIELNDKNLQYQGISPEELIVFLEKYYKKIIRADNHQPINSSMKFKNIHFDLIALS